MIRKLVRLDPTTGNYAEVDSVRLKREANELLDHIKTHIDPSVDPNGIWKWVVPLCVGALNETLPLPMNSSDRPLKYAIREGLLPNDFEELYASFAITISGMARAILDKVEIDGNTYMYADFEE